MKSTNFHFLAKISVLQGVSENVFWISSAIPKIAHQKNVFFLLKPCDISVGICGMKNCI